MTDTLHKNFGKLTKIENLQEAWDGEAQEFTPWLAKPENLSLLGEAIGLDLELEAQEKNVGPFRADILCKDTATGNWVLIENQLGRTDHTHLGQIMTYAAGLKAVTIVWIAKNFTEEHRAALDWLNEITEEKFNFFGVEIELWKIGESPVAPKLNVVCKPNDWSKEVSEAATRISDGSLTETKTIQLDFWRAFKDYAGQNAQIIHPTRPYPQHWMYMSIGKTGYVLAAIAAFKDSLTKSFDAHEVRAELVISDEDAKERYQALFAKKAEIEKAIGETLTWHNPEGKQMCRIYLRREADLNDKSQWENYFQWLVEKLDKMHKVFYPIIRNA